MLGSQLLSFLGYEVGFSELSFLITGEFRVSQEESIVCLQSDKAKSVG
jgi:hypothetical protein